MADTTLKAYYAYLDDLLNRRKYDEVAAHCQHILGKFSKNLGVIRRLAKAQFENGQYDEAMASYGRILSFAPQDVDAYVGLSWVSRQRNQGDNAIYYLERAYEREPNNTEVVGLLREAYRLFHDRANAKLPSSSYMVARQQVRSGLSSQAVKTLQDALIEDPRRTDLRLLLTDIYAQIGQLVDAAKSALAVLKELPDCLRANQVLATVWLEAGRPSDAQRLVARMEDVDPYLAYEVAVGSLPPDDAFTLPQLTYRAGASATTNVTPDWMTNLGDIALSEQATARPTTPVMPTPAPVIPVPVEPVANDDWLDMLTPTEDEPNVAQGASVVDGEMWFPEEDPAVRAEALRHQTEEWVTSIDPIAPPPAAAQDDWLLSAAPPPAQIDEDWLAQLGGTSAEEDSATPIENNQWLDDIDEAFGAQTVIQRNDFRRYLDEHEAVEAAQNPPSDEAADSSGTTGLTGLLSILSGEDATEDDNIFTGMTAALNEAHVPPTPASETTSDADADDEFSIDWLTESEPLDSVSEVTVDEDPFAWMQGEDIEVVEPSTEVKDFLDDALGVEEMGSLEPAQQDALAWAHASGVEMENDEEDLAVIPDDDPFAWMRESGVEFLTSEMPMAELPSPEPQLLTDTPSFMVANTDSLTRAEDDSADDLFMQPQTDSDLPSEVSSPESSGTKAAGLLAFVGNDTLTNDAGGTMGDNNDIPDWLKSSNPDETPEETPDEGMDWLADLQPVDEAAAPPVVLSVEDDDEADESVPAWMAALQDERDPDEISNLSTVESPILAEELTVDEAESGLFDTLTADGTFEDPDVVPVEEAPSWVFADPPTTVAVRPEQPEPVMPSVSFDPYDDLLLVAPPAETDMESQSVVEAQVVVDEPEAVKIEEDIPTAELVSDTPPPDEDDWLSAMAANAPSAPVVSEENEDASDDLSRPLDDFSFGADEGEEIIASDEVDFASMGFQIDEDTPAFDISPDASNDFDWLNDAAPTSASESSPFSVGDEASDEIDWLSAAAPDEAATPNFAVDDASDEMDWLSAAAPAEAAASDLTADEASDEVDWLSAAAPVSAAPSDFALEGAGDAMDWLAASAPDEVQDDDFALSFIEDQDQPSTALGVTFFDDVEDESLPVSASDAALFGLSLDTPQEKTGVSFNAITEDDDLFVAEETPVELSETSAFSAPDWLNALAPGLEVDTDAIDYAPDGEYLGGGRGDYGWLNKLVEEETRPPVMISKPRTARFPFSMPPSWLQLVRDETHPVAPMTDNFDFDGNSLPDWLDSVEDDDDDAQKN